MSRTMANYDIDPIHDCDWIRVADLLARTIPNALISKLGNRFGSLYYRKVVEHESSCGYVARDTSDNISGVIIATTDYPRVRSLAFKGQLMKLLLAANFRLFGLSVIRWLIKGILAKLRGAKHDVIDRPDARLIVITVCSQARGTGLAQKLMKTMEKFSIAKGHKGPYAILTEKANTRANNFYKKIGATFIRTNLHHGREVNEWHKEIDLMSVSG